MTPLCKIAYKYKTDKCPEISHSYTPFYYELLKDKRESIKKVLELGIGCQKTMGGIKDYPTGASLYMWRDFFPNAQIYGADALPETIFEAERIKTFLCDETNRGNLKGLIKKIGSDIDLFIDDGSHLKSNQIRVCKILKPLLKRDVIYIIEDVSCPEIVMDGLKEYDCRLGDFTPKFHLDRVVIVKDKIS
jgi:hypothetical protein